MPVEPNTEENTSEKTVKQSEALRKRLQQDQARNMHLRQHTRHECFAVGVMVLLDRSIPVDGVISEISPGGGRFRPASVYLLERKDETVMVAFGDYEIAGKIAASRPNGYGIQFYEELDEETVNEIVADYGVDKSDPESQPN